MFAPLRFSRVDDYRGERVEGGPNEPSQGLTHEAAAGAGGGRTIAVSVAAASSAHALRALALSALACDRCGLAMKSAHQEHQERCYNSVLERCST